MAFRDPVLAGTVLVRDAISSENFETGVAGWTIERDGSAEFNDVVVRGTIDASTVTSPDIISDSGDERVRIREASVQFYDISGASPELLGFLEPSAAQASMLLRMRDGLSNASQLQLSKDTSFPTVLTFSDGTTESARIQLGIGPTSVFITGKDGDTRLSADADNGALRLISSGSPGDIEITAVNDTMTLTANILNVHGDQIRFGSEAGTTFARLQNLNSDSLLLQTLNATSNTGVRITGGGAGDRYVGSTNFNGSSFREMRASAFTVSSDRRWKRDVRPIPRSVRERLRSVRAVQFTDADGLTHLGFVADDLPSDVRSDLPPGTIFDPTWRRPAPETVWGPNGERTEVPSDEAPPEVDDPLSDSAGYDVSAVLAVLFEEVRELRELVGA